MCETAAPTRTDAAAFFAAFGLSPAEVRMLAAYLYDGESQPEIGRRADMPQRTVCDRLAAAVAKLRSAGLSVRLPVRRGRRDRRPPRVRRIDPALLRFMRLDRPAGGGLTIARRNGRVGDEDGGES
jgi:uncharacterized protein with von Willebrand factor type A (vWA) domain